ncbi:hypothetical protein BDV59DRAFT_211996 [Aspergillus ambiguus]|uniref:fungal specific transcription factor domain-containing protein n=1 Tax=Aspergillus ambiguus TaxID=176160 RepID=UPI003CCD5834
MTIVQHYCPSYNAAAMTTMLVQFRASNWAASRTKSTKPPVKLACLSCVQRKGKNAPISPVNADVPGSVVGPDGNICQSRPSVAYGPVARIYGSEVEILDAYYRFIHPYFPVLPPRATHPASDCPLKIHDLAQTIPIKLPYTPHSPLSLAISSILALVPHPEDPDPSSETSTSWRRSYSQTLSQMASLSIEADSQAGIRSKPSLARHPFHPRVPVDLERILALLILSIYEYSQTGNLTKMRNHADQALTLALGTGIHRLGEDNTQFAEARRRAWWMTYYCSLQGSIVSECGWDILIQAQQVLALANKFKMDLAGCLSTGSNTSCIFCRMKDLDDTISTMLAQSRILPVISRSVDIDDWSECVTVFNIRAISRTKLFSAQMKVHQPRVFLDNPIIGKLRYDLAPHVFKGSACTDYVPVVSLRDMGCYGNNRVQSQFSSAVSRSWTFSSGCHDNPISPMTNIQDGLPLSAKYSVTVCLRAALAMSHIARVLLRPDSLYELADHSSGRGKHHRRLGLNRNTHSVLAVPSLAYCLTQGCCIISAICYKARKAETVSPKPESSACGGIITSATLIKQLKRGLQRIVLAMAKNDVVFEGLRGTRDEIERAYQKAFPVS